jgi:hypothetical protein
MFSSNSGNRSRRALEIMARLAWNREIYALILERLVGLAQRLSLRCLFPQPRAGRRCLSAALERSGLKRLLEVISFAENVNRSSKIPSSYDRPTKRSPKDPDAG